jgi:threonine synthase
MDVGAPSNFERMAAHWNYDQLKKLIKGAYITDDETRKTIGDVFNNFGYYLDPHGAVGWTAVEKLRANGGATVANSVVAVLATAHPAKFSETVENITGPVPVPPSIEKAMSRTAHARTIPADLSALRDTLLAAE